MAITIDGTNGIVLPTWTTGTRPSSPSAGQFGFNSTLGCLEWYSSATSSWSAIYQGPSYVVDYLMVAGGGGGGFDSAGGGGAGGYKISNTTLIKDITYTITVGAGGTAANSSVASTNGSNTSITSTNYPTISVVGGGAGRGPTGQNGGSGGGAGGTGGKGIYPGSTYIDDVRQGYDGGNGTSDLATYGVGGGGGGGGAAGETKTNAGNGTPGGNGGAGIYSSISGANTAYCGGGGGAGDTRQTHPAGTGGVGGGGNGSSTAAAATSGTVNTGGGGGGAPFGGSIAGAGGSGIVILSWPTTVANVASVTGTYNYSESGGKRILKFTSSGTISF